MFAWGDGKVLRLYRHGWGPAEDGEMNRLKVARVCGVRVPAEFGRHDLDGRAGLVMERISGPDLLVELGNKPWRLLQVGGLWGRVQAEMNSKRAPPDLESARDRARRLIESSERIPADIRDAALRAVESLPFGDRLLHGDCHPANIMRHGDELVIIDWSNVCRGPAEADLPELLDVHPGRSPSWNPMADQDDGALREAPPARYIQ